MGIAVLERLAATTGAELLATDARPERRALVNGLGAGWAPDNRSVAAAADVLLTLLPGSAELRDAMGEATDGLRSGSTWIDMTSADPQVALELMEHANWHGVSCLDAPIGGGPPAVRQGTAQLFVGGDRGVVEHQRRLLATLGTIEHVGAQGTGYASKLVVNLLWFTEAIAVVEALLLAKRRGVEIGALREALARSAASSAFLGRDLSRLLEGDYLTTFGLGRCVEELEATVEMAEGHGLPCDLTRLVRDTYGLALARYGHVDGELLPVAMLEEQAGFKLAPE